MSAVPTPCTGVCAIDETSGLCRGCLRTLDEIARWSTMRDGERRAVVKALAGRTVPSSRLGANGS